MTSPPLATLVDLERYPIDALGTPAGLALIERARSGLRDGGACDLPGFLTPTAVEAAMASALAVQGEAFRTEQMHDVEFSGLPDPSLAPDDARRLRVRSAKAGIAGDRVPADSPVRALYESEHMLQFVGRALELEAIYRSDDPLGALNYMYYVPGDELGWHFDDADFVVTLTLQAATSGGVFEFVPMLRRDNDRNDVGVRRLLQGDHTGVRTMRGTPGTLALFRGHLSPHRVTPVEGDTMRVNAVLSYATTAGHRLNPRTYATFYGRAPHSQLT